MIIKKRTLLGLFICLFLTTFLFFTVNSNGPAYADSEVVGPTVEFGASVKLTQQDTGMRFTWSMSKAQYNSLKESEDKVEFGMIIAPSDYNDAVSINAENVFGENNKYTDAERMANGESLDGKKQILNLHGSELYYDTEKDLYLFRGVIANIKPENYTRKFIGVGYIAVTGKNAEKPTYTFADNKQCSDNGRTVTFIAEKAYQDYSSNESYKKILDGFIENGYKNLGLDDENIISDEEYDILKTACDSEIILGSGKSFKFSSDVSESKYVFADVDFEAKNMTFEYPIAESVIENFIQSNTNKSAYGLNEKNNPSRFTVNASGVWHPQFEGRYGVLEIKPSKYTAKTSNNSAKDGYHLQSSFRDESFYATNESWDYVSVWVYVEGAENEEVTMSTSWYNTCKTTVKCNEWVEYRLNKTGALNVSVLNGIKSQEVIAKWLAYRINGSTAPLLAIDTESESIGNRKIYIDSISYDKAITFKASGKAETGSSITLTASATGNISDGFEYSVKKPGSKDYEGISGNTFVPTEAGVYEFKATRIIDGVKRSEIIEIVIGASNTIESFDSESSVNAAYGLNAKGNPDKNSLNATAVWHSEYSGKQGVLELQPSGYYSSSSAKRDLYHLKSSFRDGTYYADNDDWDYISIWLYVEGTENEEVKISVSLYGSCQVTVKCNEWVEFRIDKERARSLSSSSTYVDQSGATVSGKNQQTLAYWMSKEENSITLRAPLIAIDTASTEKTTRKIFVDKISYEKNA